MELTNDQIKQILPHRYPMQLVDRITQYQPGQFAKGIKCVSGGEPYFTGHFPGRSIMPGVLIVEALAQVGGIALMTLEANRGKLAVLAGIKNVRFRKPVFPGDVLEMECSVIRQKGSVGVATAAATVAGVSVCTAEISFALIDNEQPIEKNASK